MDEEKIAVIIDRYEDLLSVIDELNKDVPKIKKLYSGLKSDIESGVKKLDDEAEMQRKAIHEASDKIEDYVTSAEQEIEKRLKQNLNEVKKTLNSVEAVEKRVQEYIKKADTFLSKITSAEDRLAAMDSMLKETEERVTWIVDKVNSLDAAHDSDDEQNEEPVIPDDEIPESDEDNNEDDVEINYNERGTIQYLYEKYKDRVDGPVIVDREGWAKDYCIVIREETEGYYHCTPFKEGKKYGGGEIKRYPKGAGGFKLYNGPSRDAIIEYCRHSY